MRLLSIVPELHMLLNTYRKAMPRMGYESLLLFVIFRIYFVGLNMMIDIVQKTLQRGGESKRSTFKRS